MLEERLNLMSAVMRMIAGAVFRFTHCQQNRLPHQADGNDQVFVVENRIPLSGTIRSDLHDRFSCTRQRFAR